MNVTVFRVLVVLDLLLVVFGLIADYGMRSQLPEELRDYLAAQEEEAFGNNLATWVLTFGGVGVLVLGLVSTVGLLCLWRPARFLYTLGFIVTWPLYFFMGPSVMNSTAHLLYDMANVLGGVIWALIYFSPLKAHFERPAEPLPA